ncbi:MAG TPA: type II toxin-antitoxin system VapC family toxin [Clostridia bacterium]|nr:type II toxin-antitoxin system VapC family toxin [Clostridia bacterium]
MERVEEAQRLGILRVVHVSEAVFSRGWELFRERPDKEWSLTDCISFVVMQSHRCRRAFTSDSHFVQAGFERLIVP